MTRDVVTARPATGFKELAALMERHRVRSLPVVDERRRVIGLVSQADLLAKEANPGAALTVSAQVWPARLRELAKAAGRTAGDVMTRPAVTVSADSSAVEAARLMRARGVTHLPVVDPATGTLLGMVGRSDLLSVYVRRDEDLLQEILDEVVHGQFLDPSHMVTVTVADGVVTLTGHVTDRPTMSTLMWAVHRIEGVVGVNNALTIRTEQQSAAANPPGAEPGCVMR